MKEESTIILESIKYIPKPDSEIRFRKLVDLLLSYAVEEEKNQKTLACKIENGYNKGTYL